MYNVMSRKDENDVLQRMRKKLKMQHDVLLEDAFEAKKQWGFFSKKDMKLHSFVLCEECYDRITAQFVIPPDVSEVTEL